MQQGTKTNIIIILSIILLLLACDLSTQNNEEISINQKAERESSGQYLNLISSTLNSSIPIANLSTDEAYNFQTVLEPIIDKWKYDNRFSYNIIINPDASELGASGDERIKYQDLYCTRLLKAKILLLNEKIRQTSELNGYRLVISEAFDANGIHATNSLHYDGRAVDLLLDPFPDQKLLKKLEDLITSVGFNWINNEGDHIHASVVWDNNQFPNILGKWYRKTDWGPQGFYHDEGYTILYKDFTFSSSISYDPTGTWEIVARNILGQSQIKIYTTYTTYIGAIQDGGNRIEGTIFAAMSGQQGNWYADME